MVSFVTSGIGRLKASNAAELQLRVNRDRQNRDRGDANVMRFASPRSEGLKTRSRP